MKKKLILAACMVAFACACQSKAPPSQNGNGSTSPDRGEQKPSGGCCEIEKSQAPKEAPKENQTAATPEVKPEVKQEIKVEKTQ